MPTVDPLAEKYYSISPYAYCKGDPVNYIDPNGEFSLLGAAWFWLTHGGGNIGKDKATGEYFVGQKVESKTAGTIKRNFDNKGRTHGEKQYGQENGASINGTGSSQLMELSTSKYHEPSIDMQDASNAAVDMLAKMFKNVVNNSTSNANKNVNSPNAKTNDDDEWDDVQTVYETVLGDDQSDKNEGGIQRWRGDTIKGITYRRKFNKSGRVIKRDTIYKTMQPYIPRK